jgi:transposase-like protein
MSINRSIDPAIKAEVISKIRDHGMKVSDVALDYNISTKTIYRWLRDRVIDSSASLVLQINRLKKENEQLYKLLGRATAEMHRSKK